MAQTWLESSALSAFFGSLALMVQAGIQTEEAMLMLSENREASRFQEVCAAVYGQVVQGKSLSQALEASGGFPSYAVRMVAMGEASGHLEQVLRNLELYYDEEDRMFAKLRASVGYPCALLLIMTFILAVAVFAILPVFGTVYEGIAGSLALEPLGSLGAARIVGVLAFALTALATLVLLCLFLQTGSERGRARILRLFQRLPLTHRAMEQLALSRFTAALATYLSSGVTNEDALAKAMPLAGHEGLQARLEAAHASMLDLDDPRSLSQAIGEQGVLEPLYARMLQVGMSAGSADETLAQLSAAFFDDAVAQVDRELDKVEPLLAAFLTLAVGATLVAVMLPLVGIMGSIA